MDQKVFCYICDVKYRIIAIFSLVLACVCARGQDQFQDLGTPMAYEVLANGDTVYVDYLDEITITADRKKKKKKTAAQWRKYYRLVYNFNKVYPYALVGREMMAQVDSTLEHDNMRTLERERYINNVELELFRIFEKDLRSMTITQGYVLMRLVDRECGMSPHELIKTYEGKFAADFWQVIAKLFDNDLKQRYDPYGKDSQIEELVQIWDFEDWDEFYFTIFAEYPPKTDVLTRTLSERKKK